MNRALNVSRWEEGHVETRKGWLGVCGGGVVLGRGGIIDHWLVCVSCQDLEISGLQGQGGS